MLDRHRPLTHPHREGLTDGARLISCAAALLLIGAGVIHVSAAADHTNLPVMLAGFLVVATAQVGLGALLLWRRPGRLLIFAMLALTAGAIGMWFLSRTAGLPLLPGGHMEPIGFKDGITVLFELAALPALLLLASREVTSVTLPSPRLGTQALGILGAGVFALFVPALVLGGGGHHSAGQMAAMSGHSHGEQGEEGHADRGLELAQAGPDDGDHGGGGHSHGGSRAGGSNGGHEDGHFTMAGGGRTGSGQLLSAFGGGHSHSGAGGAPPTSGGHDQGTAPATGGGQEAGGHDHGSGGGAEQRSDPGGGHDHGDTKGNDHSGKRHGTGGGRQHGGDGGHGGGSGKDHGGHQGDSGHGGGHAAGGDHGHAGGGDHGHGGDDEPKQSGMSVDPAQPAKDGRPARGTAVVFRGQSDGSEGENHHHGAGACQPTAEQQAAADKLFRDTDAALHKYDNNPMQAMADGFYYAFGPTDRIMHMVNPQRVYDPTILDPNEIESFLYVMTDKGLVPVGGMYIMPKYGMAGPQIGGCLTKWHHHGGLGGRLTTAGTQENTPEMLHVYTYPGLDPWGHYDGRELSQLWTPGSAAPSVCREYGDASDVCLP